MDRDTGYALLSDLVFKGFLCGRMNIGSDYIVFKTITDRELELVKMLTGSKMGRDFTLCFMAHSVFSINGENILMNRGRIAGDLMKFFSGIPAHLFNNSMKGLNDLRNDALNSMQFIEGFSYTDGSRQRWKSLKSSMNDVETFTGVPGTGSLGFNVHQQSWVYINNLLDQEELYNKEFSLALLVASASNPKGVKRVRGQHDTQMKSSQERRNKLAKRGSSVAPKKHTAEDWAAPVDTREELVAELNRQMNGFKDKHDLFIENYMEKLKAASQKRAAEAKARIEASRDKDAPLIEGSQRALTAEETKNLMRREKTVITVDSEEKASVQDKENFYNKVGHRVITGK